MSPRRLLTRVAVATAVATGHTARVAARLRLPALELAGAAVLVAGIADYDPAAAKITAGVLAIAAAAAKTRAL